MMQWRLIKADAFLPVQLYTFVECARSANNDLLDFSSTRVRRRRSTRERKDPASVPTKFVISLMTPRQDLGSRSPPLSSSSSSFALTA